LSPSLPCTNKGDNQANGSTFIANRCHSADYPGIHQLHKHYIYPLMPSLAHLLPLTGSAHRAIHGELAFNRWKTIQVMGLPASACQFATLDRSWRSLRPSAGQVQQ